MAACLLCIQLPTATVAAVFDGLPDVIVCSVEDPTGVLPWDELSFYVSARTDAGTILYKSLTSNPILLIVDLDGRVRAENLADCDGRTVAALRESGRAFDFSAPGGR